MAFCRKINNNIKLLILKKLENKLSVGYISLNKFKIRIFNRVFKRF